MVPAQNDKQMKLLRVVLVAIFVCGLAACGVGGASGKPFAASSPHSNHSLIHVYRQPRSAGSIVRFYLSANGVRLTTLTNGGYFTYEAEPGNVTFAVKVRPAAGPLLLLAPFMGDEELITIPVEPNQVYFVRFSIGVLGHKMELVDASTGEAEIRGLQAFEAAP